MVLVSKLNLCLFWKSIFQLLIHDNISNIALFKDDTVLSKLMVQLIHHGVSHVGFKIKNVDEPHSLDEISDVFLYFSGKDFIESCSTKFVNESFNLLLVLGKSESEMDIDIDVGVIFGWASLNWSIVVNNVFGKHACNSLVEAVAPVGTSLHDTSWSSTTFLKNNEVSWHIKFDIKAAALVRSADHNNNALLVWVSLTLHLLSGILKVGGWNLNDSGSLGLSVLSVLLQHFSNKIY